MSAEFDRPSISPSPISDGGRAVDKRGERRRREEIDHNATQLVGMGRGLIVFPVVPSPLGWCAQENRSFALGLNSFPPNAGAGLEKKRKINKYKVIHSKDGTRMIMRDLKS
jgi:hypothetical protein